MIVHDSSLFINSEKLNPHWHYNGDLLWFKHGEISCAEYSLNSAFLSIVDIYFHHTVYCLFYKRNLVYVGISNGHLSIRLNCHIMDEEKVFDVFSLMEYNSVKETLDVEKCIINLCKPAFNLRGVIC